MEVIYDIFCDASVGPDLRGACAGCIIVRRDGKPLDIMAQDTFLVIQPNGTNNSGELEALCLGVNRAAYLLEQSSLIGVATKINIFSDSQISIKGVRDWIFNWYHKDSILYKKDGSHVMNQNFIKLIYNTIVMRNVRVNFYHQKGHVGNNLSIAEKTFHSSNGVYCSTIGVTPEYISYYNDLIDNHTRDTLSKYVKAEAIGKDVIFSNMYTHDEYFVPIFNDFRDLSKYKRLIGK